MPAGAEKVGQSATYQDPKDQYDAEHGTYSDPTAAVSMDEKLAMKQFPKGPEKSPFTLGAITPKGG